MNKNETQTRCNEINAGEHGNHLEPDMIAEPVKDQGSDDYVVGIHHIPKPTHESNSEGIRVE